MTTPRIQQMILAADFNTKLSLERNMLRALRAIDASKATLLHAQARLERLTEDAKLRQPLYVNRIVLCGVEFRDMYDDHPGLAHFTVDRYQPLAVRRPYVGLDHAQRLAERLLRWSRRDYDDDKVELYDGLFVAESVRLEDQFCRTIQEFDGKRWADTSSLPSESEWPTVMAEAREYSQEASEEARWDNFESSRHAGNLAAALRRKVEMAQLLSRVIR